MTGDNESENNAQERPARAKGPPVFLDYDQQALDDAYDQAVYAGNGKQLNLRNAANSEAVRRRIGAPRREKYGDGPKEQLDIYSPKIAGAPIQIYLHGGAWRSGTAADFGYAAEMFLNAGAHYVVPDFDNVQDVGGSLAVMADQVRRAVVWVYRNAAAFGGDINRLYISGRSSGAHLGGVLATTDWAQDFGLPADFVKGYVLTSGMYDLRGPRLSKRSNYVSFTDEIEQTLSPQRHLERINAPVVLLYGSHETPEFKRQTVDFAAALKRAGKPVELRYCEGYNHYEMGESIGHPYGPAGRAALEQMGLLPRATQA